MADHLIPLRDQLQERLLRVILITGFFALVAVTMEELKYGNTFRVFVFYLPSFFITLLLFSFKIIPQNIKSILIVLILTVLGFSELYFDGLKSMAFLLLFAAVILAVLLCNTRWGVFILALSLVFTTILLNLYNKNILALPYREQLINRLVVNWISPVILFMTLTISCLAIIHIVIKTLVNGIEKQEKIRKKLEEETRALANANRDLEKMAYIDQVTGLPNNTKYLLDLEQLIIEREGEDYSLHQILIELVDFADFNVKYGIEFSNGLLKNAGKRLNSITDCVIYRETGAQFLIQCFNQKVSETLKINEAVISCLSAPFSSQEELVFIKFRGADINYPQDIASPRQLISTLTMTLNDSNHQGYNNIIPHNMPNILEIQRKYQIKELLKESLNRNEIFTHIQPRLDTASGKISGGELLIRWNSQELGLVSPDEFIPLAEKETIIFDLTLFVLDSLDLIIERDFKKNMTENPTFSLNISPILLHSNQMAYLIERLEAKEHWANIEFELTEGILIGKSEIVLEGIRNMQKKKIGISIDDFGTGYSNIEYLQDLEADILKIDKRFISGLPHNEKQKKIVRAIINIAMALGLYIVAEGVEYQEQYDWLKKQGVQEIQGFHLSRAIGFNEFIDFVKTHKPQDWL